MCYSQYELTHVHVWRDYKQSSVDYSQDRAEVHFDACFDSLFVIFFPGN